MATAEFQLAPPAGYTVQADGAGQKLLPTGLTYDGTDYTGADGEYDVYNIGATGMWQLEVVTLGEAVEPEPDPDPEPEPEPGPDPEPETATATFQLAPPAGFAVVVMASGYDDYAFQGWIEKPIAGVTQVVYSTADNTTLLSNGELQTDSTTTVEMYAISGTGMWTYAPITNLDQLPVADSSEPTLDAPTLVSEIPSQTATEGEVFSLDLAPFFAGDEVTYSVTGWAEASVTGSTLTVTPTEADVTASPISVTATATNATGSVSSTFAVTVEAAAVNPDPDPDPEPDPDPGTGDVERQYTITATKASMPVRQHIGMYQGDRVRLTISHDFDLSGKTLRFKLSTRAKALATLIVPVVNGEGVIQSEQSETMPTAVKVWQLILSEGEDKLVVAEGTCDVRPRIREE